MKKPARKLVTMNQISHNTIAAIAAAAALPLFGAGTAWAGNPPPASALSEASPETLLKWADADRSRGQCSVAIGLYSQVLQNSPQNAAALMGRGKAYLARREFVLALADYDKAVEAAPQSADAFYGRATVRLMMQEQAEQNAAIASGGEAAASADGSVSSVNSSAPACAAPVDATSHDATSQKALTDLIIADLDKATQLKPNLAALWFRKAAVCESAGRTNEARAAYETFLARSGGRSSVARTQAQARLAVLVK